MGELSGALKRAIEDRFGFVRVRGEISNYRGPHSSGHAYFCLKDDAARIDAVIWKTAFARLKTKPQEGLEVVATGRVTTFPGKSTYQIVIESIEPAGVGALMAILEGRRQALAAEGLFDESRKRPLPFLPQTIGVVTSPTGAVIRDILHRISDRFPRDVIVWPVRVQGDDAAEEIAAGIAGFNAIQPGGAIPRPDIILVARGGGSLEDLWAFNEEIVVRAAAASVIPLVSAVGHETDWTLIDHVGRPPLAHAVGRRREGGARPCRSAPADGERSIGSLSSGMRRALDRWRRDIRALSRALPEAEAITAMAHQRLDGLESRLASAARSGRDRRHIALGRLASRLSAQAPRLRLVQQRHALDAVGRRMMVSVERDRERRGRLVAQSGQRLHSVRLTLGRNLANDTQRHVRAGKALTQAWADRQRRRVDRVSGLAKLLQTLGYRNVLSRGFALVRDPDGRPVRDVIDASAAVNARHRISRWPYYCVSRRKPNGARQGGSVQGHFFLQGRPDVALLAAGVPGGSRPDFPMNRFDRRPTTAATEAELEYLDGDFRVVRPGAFVRCAATGVPIPVEELRYWNVDLQEPYASPEAKLTRLGIAASARAG